MNKSVQDMLFQSKIITLHFVPSTSLERVVTMRENNRGKLMLIIQHMTLVKISDVNFVLPPEGQFAT